MTPPRVPDATIETLLELEARATPGDWSIPQPPAIHSPGTAGAAGVAIRIAH